MCLIDYYFAAARGVQYGDGLHVCLPVFPLGYIKTTWPNFLNFLCVTWGRSSCDDSGICSMLRTAGFVDDVLFSHNGHCGIGIIYVSAILEQVVINFQHIRQVWPS